MRIGMPGLVLAVVAASSLSSQGYAAVTTARSTLGITIRSAAVLSINEPIVQSVGTDGRVRAATNALTTEEASRDGRFTDGFAMDGGAADGALRVRTATGSNLAVTAKILAGAGDTASLNAVPGGDLIGAAHPVSAAYPVSAARGSVTYILTAP